MLARKKKEDPMVILLAGLILLCGIFLFGWAIDCFIDLAWYVPLTTTGSRTWLAMSLCSTMYIVWKQETK